MLPSSDANELIDRICTVDDGYVIESSGLKMLRSLSPTEWATIGERIAARVESGLFALGDWLIYGGRLESAGELGGSVYRVAARITGYSVKHLSNAFRVASAFPPADRFSWPITWKHHLIVLSIPSRDDRMALLRRAAEQKLNSKSLERILDREFPRRGAPGSPRSYTPRRHPREHAKCPNCGHVFKYRDHLVN